jgi:hypothetical protein
MDVCRNWISHLHFYVLYRLENTYWLGLSASVFGIQFCQGRTLSFLLMVGNRLAKSCTHTYKLCRLVPLDPVPNLDLPKIHRQDSVRNISTKPFFIPIF